MRYVGSHPSALVDFSLDVPDGFSVQNGLVPNLAYPFELAGIANVPVAPRDSRDETGFPHADLVPARGVFMWLVVYDSRYDPFEDYKPSRDGGRVAGLGSYGREHEDQSRWDNVRVFNKIAPIGPFKSVQAYGFAGTSPSAPLTAFDQMLKSLEIAT
jgi:hypothetical protein